VPSPADQCTSSASGGGAPTSSRRAIVSLK
jgi:hypothetical protein